MIAVLLGVSAGTSGAAADGQTEALHRTESAHYVILASPGTPFLKRSVPVLEQFYDMFATELGLSAASAGEALGRITIRVFPDQGSFDAYARAVSPRWVGYMGFATRDGLAIVQRSRFDATVGMLVHEVTHRMLAAVVSRPPVWLNEGLACYFGVIRVRFGRVRFGEVSSKKLVTFRRALRTNRFIKLKELIAMKRTQFYARPGSGETMGQWESLTYAESWALVHFLRHTGKKRYRGAFARYLDRLKAGENSVEAFRAVYGPDLKAVERDWFSYVRRL